MTEKKSQVKQAENLRRKAEEIAREKTQWMPENIETPSIEDTPRILHELRVHQIELETQNDELRHAQEELENSRARYFDLYDLAPVGYFTLNEQGIILEANLTAAGLLGMTRSALIRQPLSRFILKDDQDIYYLYRKRLFGSNESKDCEIRMLRAGAAPFWTRLEATTAQNAYGAPICRAVVSDITERKRTEEALKKSVQILRDTGEMAKVGAWEMDISTREVLMTEEVCRIHGVKPGYKMKLEEAMNFYAPESKPALEAVLKKAMETGETYDLESLFIPSGSNEKIWVRSLGKAVYSGGKLVKLSGTFQNIDKYKRAEESLQKERKRLYEVLDTLPAMICLLTPDYHVTFANRSFREKFGESHGRRCYEYCFGRTAPCNFCEAYNVLKTGKPHHWEVAGPDGGSILDVYDFPFTDVDGSPLILEMNIDITERKRAEDALRRSESALAAAQTRARLGSWELNLATQTSTWSDEMFRLFGCDPALGAPSLAEFLEMMHPEDRHLIAESDNCAIHTGETSAFEFRSNPERGTVRHFSNITQATKDPDGRVIMLVGAVLDITERKRTEESLRQSLTELETLHSVSSAMRTMQTIEEALPCLMDETLSSFETDAGAIWLYHEASGELRLSVARGWLSGLDDTTIKPGEGITGMVFSSGKAHISAEFASDPLILLPNCKKIPAGWGGACMPIRASTGTVGVLFISIALPRQVTPAQIKLLDSLAQMAGTTMHRMSLRDQTLRRLKNLQALRAVDNAITATLNLQDVLNILLEHVTTQLNVDAADVLLFHKRMETFEYTAGYGFRTNIRKTASIRSGEGFAGRAVRERQTVQVLDPALAQENPHCAALWASEGFVAYYGEPIIAKDEVKGVLEVFHRTPLTPDPEWKDFIKMLAGQAAIAIDNAQLFNNVQLANLELSIAYDATIEGWSRALDLRDNMTEGHTLRVTEMTLSLARTMGMTDKELIQIRRGALLHDIGKMGIPDSILLKPGKLTEAEWEIMRKHPAYAYELLSPISYLRHALDIPYCHHEKWDGSGYPRGLKGLDIPLVARLFSVVDVFDALNSERPYRKAWTKEKILEYIREQRGGHFDPEVVDIFLEELRKGLGDNANYTYT